MVTINRAAFFDLDKTLIPGSSLFLLARGLYDKRLFKRTDLVRFAWAQLMFRLRGEAPEGIDTTRESALAFVVGHSQEELMEWGREIAAERIMPLVYEDIARVIQTHKARGDLTFLVTAAPMELATTIASELGMDGAVGTEAEVDTEGFYTGRLVGGLMHGPEKAKAVQRLADERGIDLGECAAYSDSINDLPLLEAVGHAHAVNPEAELRRLALRRGWPIHELRTRRKFLLVGIPAGLGGATLFWGGVVLGMTLERRRSSRRARFNRLAHRLLMR